MVDLRGPVCKYSRAFGRKVDNKPPHKDPLSRRPYPPGPRRRRKRLSDYGKHLREVQIARFIYRIYEKQFRRYFLEAKRSPGRTDVELVRLLERRLDNVIYKAGFAVTRRQARQLVVHRHFEVKRGDHDWRCVDRPSFQVRVGDRIRVKPSKREKEYFQLVREEVTPLKEEYWLSVDPEVMEIEVTALPEPREEELAFDPAMIVEYYSKYV